MLYGIFLLRITIREAKKMFYARTFLLYENDMRKTWVINDTLQSNRRSKCQSEFRFGNRIICDTDEIAIILMTSSLISPVHCHNKCILPILLITILITFPPRNSRFIPLARITLANRLIILKN